MIDYSKNTLAIALAVVEFVAAAVVVFALVRFHSRRGSGRR